MKCLFTGTGWSIPSPERHNTSLFLQNADQGLLIDCNGVAAERLTAAGFAFESLEHIFLTHEHTDHIGAIGNFVTQIWLKSCHYRPDDRRTAPLTIHANGRTLARVQAIFAALGMDDLPHLFPLIFRGLPEAGGRADIAGLTFDYFPVNHGATPCFGIAVQGARRGLVYSGDTEPLPELYVRVKAGDTLIHECNSLTLPQQAVHTTWPQLRALLPGMAAAETWLVHLPPFDGTAEMWRIDGDMKIMPATDGQVIDF